ncbi:MAG: hypothetical protein RLZZ488_761 [Pseudomonadota bacterium]
MLNQNFSQTPNHNATLLWFVQNNFTSRELRLFRHIHMKCGVLNQELDGSVTELERAICDCLTDERRSAIKKDIRRLASETPQSGLLSCQQLAEFTARPLPADFPLAMRFLGEPNVLRQKRVAIVGSRQPTFYGREQAARFARTLAENGVCVVSGAAIGIDTVANLMAHAYGASVAVLGSGLAMPYPRSNLSLLSAMSRSGRGLILSEFPDQQRAEKWNFPRRNRIIAGLCDFLLVVEAGLASGTLITAHLAADLGVEVGALPGPVHSPTSQGSNLLIKEGAFCIERPEEILERFVILGHQESGHQETAAHDEFRRQPVSPPLF